MLFNGGAFDDLYLMPFRSTLAGLRERGHHVEVLGPWEAGGSVQLIARDAESGMYLRGD